MCECPDLSLLSRGWIGSPFFSPLYVSLGATINLSRSGVIASFVPRARFDILLEEVVCSRLFAFFEPNLER